MAWLCNPARADGNRLCAKRANSRLPAGLSIGTVTEKSRASTRYTFPSTTG